MSSKNKDVNFGEFAAALQARLAAGERPADVWPDLPRYAEKLTPAEFVAQAAELDALAELFPDEVRGVASENYAVMNEVDTGAREGPDWKFESFLATTRPAFRLARAASYDLANGVTPWLNFDGRYQIRHWSFDNLRSRTAQELQQIFSEEFFRNSSGATLRWIDGEKEDYRALFSRPEFWKHWQTLRLEWLRSSDKSAFMRWFGMLSDSSIRNLSLQSCDPGGAGFRALADNAVLAQLEELELLNVGLGIPECEILLAGKYQPRRLKRLNLDDSSISNGKPEMNTPCFVRLIQSAFFTSLEDLGNRYHAIGAKGIEALLQSPSRVTIKYLSLHNSMLRDEGLRLIFDNVWPSMREIYISYDQFTPDIMQAVRKSPLYAQCPRVSIFPMEGESIYKERQ